MTAAAALTPTHVIKQYRWGTNHYGVPVRLVDYYFEVTKVTQNDWVVTATYFQSGTPTMWGGNTIDSSSNGVVETMTYTSSGTTLTLTSATVGTTCGVVTFEV